MEAIGEPQGALGDEGALVTIDRAQQFADGLRLDDGGKMGSPGRWQRAVQIAREENVPGLAYLA